MGWEMWSHQKSSRGVQRIVYKAEQPAGADALPVLRRAPISRILDWLILPEMECTPSPHGHV